MKNPLLWLAAACLAGGLCGCGSPDPRTTVGQEMIDLKQARDAGTMRGEEYDRAKRRTLDSASTASRDQQLADLKRALDEGAINQQEYDRLHRKVLSGG